MNGNWGSWSKYFSCSVTCGEGTQTRRRLCDEPAPKYGGADCEGDDEESQPCTAATTCPGQYVSCTPVTLYVYHWYYTCVHE